MSNRHKTTRCNLRVILKCNGEFIYTPPLYLCFAAEKRPPPLVSVSLRLALDPPPSRDAVCRRCRRLRLSLGLALLEVGREARLERGGLGRAAAAQRGDVREHFFVCRRMGWTECRVAQTFNILASSTTRKFKFTAGTSPWTPPPLFARGGTPPPLCALHTTTTPPPVVSLCRKLTSHR